MKNIEHECAYTFPEQFCKRQVLLWDFKGWRARLDELKIEFRTATGVGILTGRRCYLNR